MMAQAPTATVSLRDLIALTKPRLSSLVLATTAGGLWLAGRTVSAAVTLAALVGTTLAVAGAHSLNCYIERDLDREMHRTRDRPLPAGRMDPRVALWLGVSLALLSIPLLWFGVNPLTGLLGAVALGSYVLVYTPMKTRSPWALHVGAVPGALPPLMGWTAVTGRIEAPGVVLFAILFLWQLPHFLAIAINRRDDYDRAGMKIAPIVWGEDASRRHMVVYTLALVPMTLALVPLGVAGWLYGVAAVALGGVFLHAVLSGVRSNAGAQRWSWRVFRVSLVYLAGLFLALSLDHGAR